MNTLLLVDLPGQKGVPWTKPEETTPAEVQKIISSGGACYLLMADRAILTPPKDITLPSFMELVTMHGTSMNEPPAASWIKAGRK